MEHYDEVLCPECNGPMAPRTSQYGTFWGCKRYPACKGKRDSEAKSKYDRARERGDVDVIDPVQIDKESNGVMTSFKKKPVIVEQLVQYLYCNSCNKQVSSGFMPVPVEGMTGLVVRAYIQCPECLEKK